MTWLIPVKLLVVLSVSLTIFISYGYAEQVQLPFEPAEKNCIYISDSEPPRYACVWTGVIGVQQDNLDEDDIRTLEDIAQGKVTPTFPESSENKTSVFTPVKSQRLTDADFIEESQKAMETICGVDSIYNPATQKLLGCQYEAPPDTAIVNPQGTDSDYYNNLSPMQKYAQYKENPTEFDIDDSYGKVGWKKFLKGLR